MPLLVEVHELETDNKETEVIALCDLINLLQIAKARTKTSTASFHEVVVYVTLDARE